MSVPSTEEQDGDADALLTRAKGFALKVTTWFREVPKLNHDYIDMYPKGRVGC